VKTLVDERLRRQALRFDFRFACEDCGHFDDVLACCSLGYVAAPRRDALEGVAIELCKTFEIG
jgi:hypothetical protein